MGMIQDSNSGIVGLVGSNPARDETFHFFGSLFWWWLWFYVLSIFVGLFFFFETFWGFVGCGFRGFSEL